MRAGYEAVVVEWILFAVNQVPGWILHMLMNCLGDPTSLFTRLIKITWSCISVLDDIRLIIILCFLCWST